MVFEKFIRYAGLAVGLKPSARGCEGRLRGLDRIMYANTISPAASPIYRNEFLKDHDAHGTADYRTLT